jgi:hypothetical protein
VGARLNNLQPLGLSKKTGLGKNILADVHGGTTSVQRSL